MENGWKTRTMALGAVLGALTGLGAAFILIQRAEMQDEQPKLSAGEGVKVGLGVLGLLRLISDFGKE
jgi:hypothetical protein